MPRRPGSTPSTPPETPLFAGMPTETSHSPAPSYIPHVVITLRTLRTTSSRRRRASPVTRVDAAVCERRRDHGEVAAVDRDRALAEVEVERGLGVADEHAEAPQQVRDRAVPVPGRRPRSGRRPRRPRAAGRRRRSRSRAAARTGRRPSSSTSPAQVIAPALIIGLSGLPVAGWRLISLNGSPLGSTPTRRVHGLGAAELEREPVGQRLRHRLDRERLRACRRPRRRRRRRSRGRCRRGRGRRAASSGM